MKVPGVVRAATQNMHVDDLAVCRERLRVGDSLVALVNVEARARADLTLRNTNTKYYLLILQYL